MSETKTVDWTSQEFLANPYPYYKALRESDPVHFDEARGSWILTRYHDVAAMFRDDTRLSAEQGIATSMLVTDPPAHTRLRTLVAKAFTARTVQQLAPRIQSIVDELLDAVAERDEMEAVSEFAYPLPITVITEMLGVEPERRDFFREASTKIAVALGPITDSQVALKANEGRLQLFDYFEELIRKRKAEPREDLISALIQAENRGDWVLMPLYPFGPSDLRLDLPAKFHREPVVSRHVHLGFVLKCFLHHGQALAGAESDVLHRHIVNSHDELVEKRRRTPGDVRDCGAHERVMVNVAKFDLRVQRPY